MRKVPPQADHPVFVWPLLIETLSIDLLFFIEDIIQMNLMVAIFYQNTDFNGSFNKHAHPSSPMHLSFFLEQLQMPQGQLINKTLFCHGNSIRFSKETNDW